MKCPAEIVEYMHEYLDDEISAENGLKLKDHLQTCEECKVLFLELKKTMALVKSTSHMKAPPGFTANVMARLPKEKRQVRMKRWFQHHPLLTAASLFIVLMMGSLLSTWNQDKAFSVSKQPNLIVRNNTVIVPEGKIVKGDVIVKNGELKIEGEVQGDVTVINGKPYLASAGHVTGEINEVNEVFEWMWYHIKKTALDVSNAFDIQEQDKK